MSELPITGSKYQTVFSWADRRGNRNGRLDNAAEARSAATHYCREATRKECDELLSLLEAQGFAITIPKPIPTPKTSAERDLGTWAINRSSLDPVKVRNLIGLEQLEGTLIAYFHGQRADLVIDPDIDFKMSEQEALVATENFARINRIDRLYPHKLFDYLNCVMELSNIIVLVSVYVQKAAESGNREALNRAVSFCQTLTTRIKAQKEHEVLARVRGFVPSDYHQALLQIAQGEALAGLKKDSEAEKFITEGIKGLLALEHKRFFHSPPDYFTIGKALMTLGDIYSRTGKTKEARACYSAITARGFFYENKRTGIKIEATQAKMAADRDAQISNMKLTEEKAEEAKKAYDHFLLPLANLKLAQFLIDQNDTAGAGRALAGARQALAAATQTSPWLLAQADLIEGRIMTADFINGRGNAAALRTMAAKVRSWGVAFAHEQKMAAGFYAAAGEIYYALASKSTDPAEQRTLESELAAILQIIEPFPTLQAGLEIKRVELAIVALYQNPPADLSQQVAANLRILKGAATRLAQDRESDNSYPLEQAKLLQGLLLGILGNFPQLAGGGEAWLSRLASENLLIDPSVLSAAHGKPAESGLLLVARQIFQGNFSHAYLKQVAAVQRATITARLPELFTNKERLADRTALETMIRAGGLNAALEAPAYVAYGELLLQLADNNGDPKSTPEKLLEQAMAALKTGGEKSGNDRLLQRKAVVLQTLIAARDPKKYAREFSRLTAALETVRPGTAKERGEYLGELWQLAKAELLLARSWSEGNKPLLVQVKSDLEQLRATNPHLVKRQRLLLAVVTAQLADTLGSGEISRSIAALTGLRGSFGNDRYSESLAEVTLGELLLAQADKSGPAEAREKTGQAYAHLQSLNIPAEYAHLFHKSALLLCHSAARLAIALPERDLLVLDGAIAYFGSGIDPYSLDLANLTKGELLLQAADRETVPARRNAAALQARPFLAAVSSSYPQLTKKAEIFEAALVLRQEKSRQKEAEIAFYAAKLDTLLAGMAAERGSYLYSLGRSTQGALYLALAELGGNRQFYDAAYAAYAQVGQEHSALYATALTKQLSIDFIRQGEKSFSAPEITTMLARKAAADRAFELAGTPRGDHDRLELALTGLTLLVMRNKGRDSSEVVAQAERLLTDLGSASLEAPQRNYFTFIARVRKGQALIQQKRTDEALAVLEDAERMLGLAVPPNITRSIGILEEVLADPERNLRTEAEPIFTAAIAILQAKGLAKEAAKLTEARKLARSGERAAASAKVKEVYTFFSANDRSGQVNLGFDLSSLQAELYHQLAIVHSIREGGKGRIAGHLTYEYATSACQAADSSSIPYDRNTRKGLLYQLLKQKGEACAPQ